jgi:hypothetical protein
LEVGELLLLEPEEGEDDGLESGGDGRTVTVVDMVGGNQNQISK